MNNYTIPKLKAMVEYCSLDDKIYFFGRPGVAVEIKDENKFIANTCYLMNGENNVSEIKNLLFVNYPDQASHLEALLTILDNEYFLEDSSSNYKKTLTDYDVIRWSRNIEFFGAYCKATDNKYSHQEKIKSTKVVILGLGGVGSSILYNLAAMGVCNIKAIDFDEVELSNLNRQIIYNEADIGQLKSIVAKNRIVSFMPNANVEFINKKISCIEDIEEIIHDQDIVIVAIDDPREKIMDWCNLACVKKNISFLCGALDSRLAICYSIIPGKSGCIECWKLQASNHKLLFQNLLKNKNFISSKERNLAIMPFISILSGLIASEFLKIVTGIATPQSVGQLCTFDFITSQITISENWKKDPACSVC